MKSFFIRPMSTLTAPALFSFSSRKASSAAVSAVARERRSQPSQGVARSWLCSKVARYSRSACRSLSTVLRTMPCTVRTSTRNGCALRSSGRAETSFAKNERAFPVSGFTSSHSNLPGQKGGRGEHGGISARRWDAHTKVAGDIRKHTKGPAQRAGTKVARRGVRPRSAKAGAGCAAHHPAGRKEGGQLTSISGSHASSGMRGKLSSSADAATMISGSAHGRSRTACARTLWYMVCGARWERRGGEEGEREKTHDSSGSSGARGTRERATRHPLARAGGLGGAGGGAGKTLIQALRGA